MHKVFIILFCLSIFLLQPILPNDLEKFLIENKLPSPIFTDNQCSWQTSQGNFSLIMENGKPCFYHNKSLIMTPTQEVVDYLILALISQDTAQTDFDHLATAS
jgi:hypothetical protein